MQSTTDGQRVKWGKLAAVAGFSSCAALACLEALAGAADVAGPDGEMMKIEYRGTDRVRINHGGQAGYMLVRGNEVYTVSTQDGQTMVMNMRDMMKVLGQSSQLQVPEEAAGELLSMEATGQYEERAGIRGEIYKVRYLDAEGREQSSELVLSSDKRALEFRDAMLGMSVAMMNILGGDDSAGQELGDRLDGMDKGVLRWGDDMWVTAISDRTIDAARFELPAEPMDMSALGGMGGLFGGGSAGSPAGGGSQGAGEESQSGSGGILSGVMSALGKKPAEEPQPESDEAEEEPKEDNALGKALNSIFGR